MKVNAVNPQLSNPKHPRLKAAGRGAVLTSGLLTASAGISWATRPQRMQEIVSEYGGTNQYLKAFATGLVILSAMGAAANTALSIISDKISPKKPPKAVN